jgi:hypothetical protein
MPSERTNERLARHIVATALGVPVTRNDDGSRDRQVDALIHLPSGEAPLEITSDHDSAFARLWKALAKIEHKAEVSGLESAWTLWLGHDTKVKALLRVLPGLMQRHEAELTRMRRIRDLPDPLTEAGIRVATRSDGSPGLCHLFADGWAGFATESPGPWAAALLTETPDNLRKLETYPDAEQRHVFVWTTIGSAYGVQFALENREGVGLPDESPDLPWPVTHLWVAGSFSSQGCLAWSTETGWWRAWDWPEGGLVLDEPGDDDTRLPASDAPT